MKNNYKLIVCLILSAFFSIGTVKAATIAIGNDSTTAGAANRSVSVELKDDDLSDYVKVEFELNLSGTSYASITRFSYSGSMSYTPNGNVYTISSDTGLYASTIGNIVYSTTADLNTSFTITPTNVKFYKADGSVYTTKDSNIKVDSGTIKYETPKSNDASLTSLSVTQGTTEWPLSPEFDSSITEYTVNVKDTINTVKITANAASGATKTGTGNKTLVMGENTFEIVVTAENGTTKKTYKVTVNRGEVSEPSAYLKNLIINNIGCELSPEFDKLNNKYTVDVSGDITELDLEYELEDPLASIEIEGNENFVDGENLITITIKASDDSDEQIYEITVNKNMEESNEIVEDEKKEEKKSSTWLIVVIVLIILLISGGAGFIIFKKKKGKGSPKVKKEKKEKIEEPEENTDLDDELPQIKDDGITEILKNEFYDDEKTTTYDKSQFSMDRDDDFDNDEEDEIEKTKEFNFKDFN